MRRKPKRGTKPALRMAARRSRIRLACVQMALISLIFVTPTATSSSGLLGKLPDFIAEQKLRRAVLSERFFRSDGRRRPPVSPECIGIPSELEQLSRDPRLDLDRLGLSPARKKESVPDPGRPVERGLAKTSQPDRDLPFRARQYPGSVDPVVGIFMVDHRLLPQLADQGNLLLLPLAAAAKMPGHFESVVFYPVPADPDAQAKPALREQVDIRSLFGEERSLPLRQDDHARY